MYCGVPEDIPYCVVGQSVIFLDMKTSRYLGLPQSSAPAFSRLIASDGEIDENDRGSLMPLFTRGYLTQIPGPQKMPCCPEIAAPRTDYVAANLGSAPPKYVLRAALAQIGMAARLATFSLPQILSWLRSRPLPDTATTADQELQLLQIASAFASVSYAIGRADRCLLRSLAMFALCRKFGILTHLVIAVRSDPFSAHCWVQRESTVLNDSVENVRTYIPILVTK